MYPTKWVLDARTAHKFVGSDTSSIAGRWPVLEVRIYGSGSCPYCSHDSALTTDCLHIEAEVGAITWHLEHNLDTLLRWFFAARECPECGISSTIPKLKRPVIIGQVKETMTAEWVRRQFAADDIGVIPKGVSRSYDPSKALEASGTPALNP